MRFQYSQVALKMIATTAHHTAHRVAQVRVQGLQNQADARVALEVVPEVVAVNALELVPEAVAVGVPAVTRLVKKHAILQVVHQDVQKNALLHVGEYVLADVVICVVPIARDFVRMNVEEIVVIQVALQHVVIVVQVAVTDLVPVLVQANAEPLVEEVATKNV